MCLTSLLGLGGCPGHLSATHRDQDRVPNVFGLAPTLCLLYTDRHEAVGFKPAPKKHSSLSAVALHPGISVEVPLISRLTELSHQKLLGLQPKSCDELIASLLDVIRGVTGMTCRSSQTEVALGSTGP